MPVRRRCLPYYADLLDSISAARDLAALRRTHAQILTSGARADDFLRSKLCSAYAACGRVPEALHILRRANRRGTFVYNSLLRAFADLSLFPAALALFNHMRSAPAAAPDYRTLSSVLRSCAGLPSLPLGRAAHASTLSTGLAAHLPVSNSLIAMYSKCGDLAAARQVFDQMPQRSLITWTAMIAACGVHGSQVAELVEGMLAGGGGSPPDAAAVTAVLAACARGGLTELGVRVFDAVREGRLGAVRLTVEHYTCMVGLLGRAGRSVEARELVAGMEVDPDEALWRAVLMLGVAERVDGRGVETRFEL